MSGTGVKRCRANFAVAITDNERVKNISSQIMHNTNVAIH